MSSWRQCCTLASAARLEQAGDEALGRGALAVPVPGLQRGHCEAAGQDLRSGRVSPGTAAGLAAPLRPDPSKRAAGQELSCCYLATCVRLGGRRPSRMAGRCQDLGPRATAGSAGPTCARTMDGHSHASQGCRRRLRSLSAASLWLASLAEASAQASGAPCAVPGAAGSSTLVVTMVKAPSSSSRQVRCRSSSRGAQSCTRGGAGVGSGVRQACPTGRAAALRPSQGQLPGVAVLLCRPATCSSSSSSAQRSRTEGGAPTRTARAGAAAAAQC